MMVVEGNGPEIMRKSQLQQTVQDFRKLVVEFFADQTREKGRTFEEPLNVRDPKSDH